jgi:phage tail P2-like protein
MRVLDELFRARVADISAEAVRRAKSASLADAMYLPWLAYEESADLWDQDWPEAEKRSWIAAQWNIHRKKGTIGAMTAAQAALGYGVRVREWFETGGAPATFRLDVDLFSRPSWEASDFARIWAVALGVKPVRAMPVAIQSVLDRTMHEPVLAFGGSQTMTLDFRWDD